MSGLSANAGGVSFTQLMTEEPGSFTGQAGNATRHNLEGLSLKVASHSGHASGKAGKPAPGVLGIKKRHSSARSQEQKQASGQPRQAEAMKLDDTDDVIILEQQSSPGGVRPSRGSAGQRGQPDQGASSPTQGSLGVPTQSPFPKGKATHGTDTAGNTFAAAMPAAPNVLLPEAAKSIPETRSPVQQQSALTSSERDSRGQVQQGRG